MEYFNWFMDFGLRMTQGYQLEHSLSQKLFKNISLTHWTLGLIHVLSLATQTSFIMFSLNLVDYPMLSLLLSTWNDLGHLPDTQGY